MNDLGIIKTNLLLFGHDLRKNPGSDRFHSHSCWQIELPHRGSMKALLDHDTLTVSSGQLLIIPPGLRHAFKYNEKPFATWSLKFKLSGLSADLPLCLLPAENLFRQTVYFMEAAFKGTDLGRQQVPAPDFKQLVLIESLISGLVSYAYFDSNKQSFTMADKVRSMIKARNGKGLTVTEAASKLNYSRGHLSLLFKKRYGMPLKTFIDQERIEIAKNLLAYTEMNVSETALAMGFNDVYYFSNFFKRLTGKSPLKYFS